MVEPGLVQSSMLYLTTGPPSGQVEWSVRSHVACSAAFWLAFLFVKRNQTKRRCNMFTNSSTDSDHIKLKIGVKTPENVFCGNASGRFTTLVQIASLNNSLMDCHEICTNISVTQRFNPNDSDDHLTFPHQVLPPSGLRLWFWIKCLNNHSMDHHEIWRFYFLTDDIWDFQQVT